MEFNLYEMRLLPPSDVLAMAHGHGPGHGCGHGHRHGRDPNQPDKIKQSNLLRRDISAGRGEMMSDHSFLWGPEKVIAGVWHYKWDNYAKKGTYLIAFDASGKGCLKKHILEQVTGDVNLFELANRGGGIYKKESDWLWLGPAIVERMRPHNNDTWDTVLLAIVETVTPDVSQDVTT